MASPTQISGLRIRDGSINQTKLAAEVRTMLAEIADKANTTDLIGGDNKLLASLLPDAVVGGMKYQGVWDAATNAPAIPAAASSNAGHYYKVSVSGTTAVDDIAEWAVGDWIVSNGTSWDKIDNSEKTEEALTTAYDKTVKNLLQATNVQGAIDELASSSKVNIGYNAMALPTAVDFATQSLATAAKFVVGYTGDGLFPAVQAGQTILVLSEARIYTVQDSGPLLAGPELEGLAIYNVKTFNKEGFVNRFPAGIYIVHRNSYGVVHKSRVCFDDMMFDSATKKTVKSKIEDLDSNTGLAARLVKRAALTGSADGTNAVFTLVGQKLVADTDEVFVDGMLQEPGVDADYVLTVSGADTVVTFNAGAIPVAGARVRISGVKA